jgi:hypothetical protein
MGLRWYVRWPRSPLQIRMAFERLKLWPLNKNRGMWEWGKISLCIFNSSCFYFYFTNVVFIIFLNWAPILVRQRGVPPGARGNCGTAGSVRHCHRWCFTYTRLQVSVSFARLHVQVSITLDSKYIKYVSLTSVSYPRLHANVTSNCGRQQVSTLLHQAASKYSFSYARLQVSLTPGWKKESLSPGFK